MVAPSDPSEDSAETFTDEGLSVRTVDQGRVTSFTCDSVAPSTTVIEAWPVPVTWIPTSLGGIAGVVVGGVGGTVDVGLGGIEVVGGTVVGGVPVEAPATAEGGDADLPAPGTEVVAPDGPAGEPELLASVRAVGLAMPIRLAVTTARKTTAPPAAHQ
jgi:hypothetical protein